MKEVFIVYSFKYFKTTDNNGSYEIIGRAAIDLQLGDQLFLQKDMCLLKIRKIISYEKELEEINSGLTCVLILDIVKSENKNDFFIINKFINDGKT